MGKKDYIGPGIFIALGVFIWAVSFQFPVLPGGHPGPSLFPRVLGTLFIFFSLIVIGESRRKSKAAPPPPEDEGGNVTITGKENYFNAVLVIILIAAFIVGAPHLGFIITGGMVLVILMWKLHVKPVRAVLISAVIICFIYMVFAKGLRVPLPHGFVGW